MVTMKQPKQINYKQIITNLFGVIGYNLVAITVILTICLIGVLILQLLSNSDAVVIINKAVSGQTGTEVAGASEAARYIGYAFAGVMLVLTLLILVVLPYRVGKLGKIVTHKITTLLHKPDNMSAHYLIKVSLSVVPFLPAVIIAPFIQLNVIFEVLVFIAVITFAAVLAFSIQVAIASLFKLDLQKVW